VSADAVEGSPDDVFCLCCPLWTAFRTGHLSSDIQLSCITLWVRPYNYLINSEEAPMVSYCTSSEGTNSLLNTSVVNAASHHFQ
nr:hypothetical protein [Tanacetum cinerariifolium]